MEIRKHLHFILLWLHHLTFSGAFSLTFGKKNGANVISNDIKPTQILNVHFNKPDAAFKTSFNIFLYCSS